MSRAIASQIIALSEFALERASAIAAQTGLTMTRVVEEALRSYRPSPLPTPPGRLVREGPFLVMPAIGPEITLGAANAALGEDRSERGL